MADRTAKAMVSAAVSRGTLIGVWAVLFLVYGLVEPHGFLTTGTLQIIFGSQQALTFLALAATSTFLVGEFDLSIASSMGLTATVVPVLITSGHVAVAVACLVGLLSAVAVGALNAFIIVRLGVNAIVTTLGMATLIGGVSNRIANNTAVSFTSPGLQKVTSGDLLGLPASFYYGLAAAAALGYILTSTPLGRRMIFVGSNRSVARLAGIRVNRVRVGAYLTSAALSGLGGLLLVGAVGGFDPQSTTSYLLPALSAAFLGTAAVQPGRFNPGGTMIAIYFLATGIIGLQILGFAGWVSDVFYGGALIVAISLTTWLSPGQRTS
jgi:ribose transport system permease protein